MDRSQSKSRESTATVSVVVPTFNSARTISKCLESVRSQTHEDWEIIVVDSCSSDDTADLSKRFGEVIVADSGSTRARLLGAEKAKGSYVLNLDSDQVLTSNALRDALSTLKPAVAFGEVSTGEGLIARVNGLDKRAINRVWWQNLDPLTGFIRPRFFHREALLAALRTIPCNILDTKPSPFSDDSLIYLQTGISADQVGFVPDSVLHEEERRVMPYLRKWRRYGQSARPYRGTPFAALATSRGKRNVNGLWKLACAPGLLARAAPFIVGYYF
jgi:glycosyltransferase involved in cell wall biosynthesis